MPVSGANGVGATQFRVRPLWSMVTDDSEALAVSKRLNVLTRGASTGLRSKWIVGS